MNVLDKVKQLASEKGYSLLALNDKAKLGKNAIYKWKTQQPSTENLKKVADVLGVSVDYLLGNTDEMHEKASDKEPAETKIRGLFRHYSSEHNLTEKQKSELIDDLDDFMAARAKRLGSKKRDN